MTNSEATPDSRRQDDELLRLCAKAAELASDLYYATQLPPCACSAAVGRMPGPGTGESWCHTCRARHFAAQVARELRILTQVRVQGEPR